MLNKVVLHPFGALGAWSCPVAGSGRGRKIKLFAFVPLMGWEWKSRGAESTSNGAEMELFGKKY